MPRKESSGMTPQVSRASRYYVVQGTGIDTWSICCRLGFRRYRYREHVTLYSCRMADSSTAPAVTDLFTIKAVLYLEGGTALRSGIIASPMLRFVDRQSRSCVTKQVGKVCTTVPFCACTRSLPDSISVPLYGLSDLGCASRTQPTVEKSPGRCEISGSAVDHAFAPTPSTWIRRPA